jgi:hypothetical protein
VDRPFIVHEHLPSYHLRRYMRVTSADTFGVKCLADAVKKTNHIGPSARRPLVFEGIECVTSYQFFFKTAIQRGLEKNIASKNTVTGTADESDRLTGETRESFQVAKNFVIERDEDIMHG